MSLTVNFDEKQSVRVTEEIVDAEPPDRIQFAAEGGITITETLLSEFAGTSLNPTRVDFSVDGSRTVSVDLDGEASLRLETVDVGVETPDADALSAGIDALDSMPEGATDSSPSHPGAIAFTVEGAIRDVPEGAVETLSEGSPAVESITFAVEDAVRGDGGSADDVLLELTLLGYGVVVRRNGVIDVGTRGGVFGVDDS